MQHTTEQQLVDATQQQLVNVTPEWNVETGLAEREPQRPGDPSNTVPYTRYAFYCCLCPFLIFGGEDEGVKDPEETHENGDPKW